MFKTILWRADFGADATLLGEYSDAATVEGRLSRPIWEDHHRTYVGGRARRGARFLQRIVRCHVSKAYNLQI
jgi:hypothetical protein